MGTERHATAAVNADEGAAGRIQVDGIDGAGPSALPAANAKLLPDYHATIPALAVSPRGASHGARRRIAGQARLGLKAGGKTACRPDPNPRHVPRKALVHQTGAGQGTGVTTNASFHAWGSQNLHTYLLLSRHGRNQKGIEIPISKSQIPNNFQSPNDQFPKQTRFDHSKLEFGYRLGFGACHLVLLLRNLTIVSFLRTILFIRA
jgi:hypothetical protein